MQAVHGPIQSRFPPKKKNQNSIKSSIAAFMRSVGSDLKKNIKEFVDTM